MLTLEKLETIIEKRITENKDLISQSPSNAFNNLMKIIMSDVRGKADAKTVAEILKKKLAG